MDPTTLIEAFQSLAEKIAPRAYPAYKYDDVLDNEEVGKVLHCTTRAIDAYVSEKGLPCHKAGVKRLFFYGEVIDWLKSNDTTIVEAIPQNHISKKSIEQKLRKNRRK